MDDGNGKFVPLLHSTDMNILSELTEVAHKLDAMKEMEAEHPNHGGWFQQGEIIELRGSKFRVQAIKPNGLYLKLLPKGE